MDPITAKQFEALRLFDKGMPPSQVDAELRLPAGTAHDIVVSWWAACTMSSAHHQKAA